jgi:glutathione peroxidase
MHYKIIIPGIVAMGLISFFAGKLYSAQKLLRKSAKPTVASIYEFKIPSLEGDTIDFSRYKGKNLLIVNTASKCGYTYQYEDLQKLHEDYGDKVTVLGFPANNFLWQEPGSNDEIASFCQRNYGVSFQMFQKVSVKGRDQHPLYQWLESKSGEHPSWNFCKYVIDKNGNVKAFYGPKVKPLDTKIIDKITL